ncbi:MAG: hypothetical protein M1827_007736 [Pycnora praestabilis]|nr:MAG: hypothetical protein M1827_007736 [Pycnora praestabilis]
MIPLRAVAFRASTVKTAAARTFSTSTVRNEKTSTFRSISTTTSQRQAEIVNEREIPTMSYTNVEEPRASSNSTISVSQSKQEPFVDGAHETPKVSFAIDKSTMSRLPPTLAKFTLQGKVAVVTGAARGLGNSMAQALCEVGLKAIAIIDVQQELGDEAAAELHEKTGVPVKFFKVDVRDAAAVSEVVGDVVDTFGSVDVLVSAAGIADSNIKASEYDAEKFRRLIDINVTGSFLVAQACGRAMITTETGGSIIFIASMSGTIVNYPQEQSCYNASKAAVIQLGKSLAAEWAQHNIRVNCISPGYMDTALNRVPALDAQKKIWTSMTPQSRLGTVDELNNLAVFLASDASTFMTGSNCIIDGGYSLY